MFAVISFYTLCWFMVIIAAFVLIYWILPQKYSWVSYLAVTLMLSYFAFRLEPNPDDDLTRYYMQIDYMRDLGKPYLDRCIELGINDWDVYRVCGYYFYFISKLSSNQYLPGITVFLVYFLSFLVIYKCAKRYEISKGYTFVGCMFFLSTYWFYDTASGIRNGLAYAIVFACAYYHLVERKRIILCIGGYVIACLLHSAAVMPVSFVILVLITLNNSGKFVNYILVFGLIFGNYLMQYLARVTGRKFFINIAARAEGSTSNDTLYTNTNFVVNIVTAFVIIALLAFFSTFILKDERGKDFRRFYKYSSIIIFFTFGSIFFTLVFMRFARWLFPLIGAMLYMIGSQFLKDDIIKNGDTYYVYYAPSDESIRFRIKGVFNASIIGYIIVHFWYLLNGSSLAWAHFPGR